MSTPETVKAQLQADIAAANAVTGKADATMHDAVASLIEGFGQCEELYRTPYSGRLYRAIEDFSGEVGAANTGSSNLYCGAEYLEEATIRGWNSIQGGANGRPFSHCPKLKKASLPNLINTSSYVFDECPSLIEASLGSIGYPVSSLYGKSFYGNTNNPDLVITVYVDAATLADVPTTVSGSLPGSAVDATIIYRNSTTGEVITE